MDIDICGPSIPKMLGLEGEEIHQSNLGWSPVYVQVGGAVSGGLVVACVCTHEEVRCPGRSGER